MRVFSFSEMEGRLEAVEVELELLPGLPHLHVIGLPDTHLKESALRIKSALTAQGYQWPRGHQVVVNLRPSHVRKQSRGLELAIAAALAWATKQAPCPWNLRETEVFIYGELGLGGEVRCPADLETTPIADCVLILGVKTDPVDGRYFEIARLGDLRTPLVPRESQQTGSWTRPPVTDMEFSEPVAQMLKVAALSEGSTLLAGPPGTGKSTWARALHALMAPPPMEIWQTCRSLHARSGHKLTWRPLIDPHHTCPVISMIGGGYPLFPGEIAKAHGGLLLLDELLQFPPRVLEALREPIEAGQMRVSRRGQTKTWPAQFQLVATTNLCQCGKLSPRWDGGCGLSLRRCRATWERLSGPVLDRFDMLLFTDQWNTQPRIVSAATVLSEIDRARSERGDIRVGQPPGTLIPSEMSLRRQRAMARVAKALAMLEATEKVLSRHWLESYSLCVKPLETFHRLFA